MNFEFLVNEDVKFKSVKRKIDGEDDDVNGDGGDKNAFKKAKMTIKTDSGLDGLVMM